MLSRAFSSAAVVIYMASVSLADEDASTKAPSEPPSIEGLWQGSWGGGEADGAIMTPVLAELFIQGNRVEARGLPNVGSLSGRIRIDNAAKAVRITPNVEANQPAAKPMDFAYRIEDDRLTLTDSEKRAISFGRCRIERDALANVTVEFVASTGIDEAGNLLVTEVTVLRGNGIAQTYFNPHETKLKTKQATVLMVQKAGLKEISLKEARALIQDSTPVAIVYRPGDRPLPQNLFCSELFRDLGPAAPDSDAVIRTVARILRPGALLFVLSSKENVPVP